MAKDPGRRPELGQFLYRLLEAIRLIAVMAWPVMPTAMERVLAMMGLAPGAPVPEDLRWGRLEPGTTLPPVAALFPRIEVAGAEPRTPKEKKVEETQPQAPGAALITIEEFAKLDLRVALVKSAEKIAGSKKLLKLEVDLGGEVRQIVSGIADAYTPESLVGRKVVLVANLKPAKLMGVESFGMVLAASLDGKAVLCAFDADVPPGTKVK
jgi:methionyl-tRNA synthetase